ncbi:MAG TPA: hypothetical protein VEH30_00035, partial [Terriglobales bacterium]|nr:hypothetical protein [Terriglobales bacterium]
GVVEIESQRTAGRRESWGFRCCPPLEPPHPRKMGLDGPPGTTWKGTASAVPITNEHSDHAPMRRNHR